MPETSSNLRKYRDLYNIHKKSCKLRKPDRHGHKIEMKLTFEQWLQIWMDSGKLEQRGRGKGGYCMARHDDLGDYEVGNVSIKSIVENSREAKLGRGGVKGRVSPTKGKTWSASSNTLRAEAAKNVTKTPCPHCSALHTQAHLARYHGDRCKLAPRLVANLESALSPGADRSGDDS
ncbi:hypothetical protein [Acidovorax sp.]|uniref:hypothetical protein n=1 Tax=Acidovorax sp. TaxID=1872122 RepID=UPI00391F46C7